jgi:serine/threonine protein kinase
MPDHNYNSDDLLKNRYKVLESLAEDLTGTIYLARDTDSEEDCILKEMKEDIDDTIEHTLLNEFTTTVKNMESIESKPDSSKMLDFFVHESKRYMVIEYKKKTLKRLRAFASLGRILEDRYIVVKGIAAGGFGVVYLVKDATLTGKFWAMKEMYEQGGDPEIIEKSFREEANLLAKIDHPNIPSISHFFTSNKRHYLIMEYIKGETLKDKLRKLPPDEYFPEEKVLDWGITICNVLDYLHNLPRPVVFRDLKPENIMFNEKGEIKLIDFGIARVFEGGNKTTIHALLTKGYAPPEQWMGKAEPRSDIYSLGVTMDYLLTKVHPEEKFPNFPPASKFNPHISEDLCNVILHAVKMKIEERFASAHDMKEALQKIKNKKKAFEYINKGKDYEDKGEYLEASFQYKKGQEYDSENEGILFSLSYCYEKIGLIADSIKTLNKIVEISKDSININKAGEIIERLSKIPETASPVSTDIPFVISINPTSPSVGETAFIDIKIPANSVNSFKGNILISSSRPDDDEITQPSHGETGLLGSIRSCFPGETFITVSDKASGKILAEKLKIIFTPALPDREMSEMKLSGPSMIDANGEDTALINITLMDKFKKPLPGMSVKFSSGRDADNFDTNPTDEEGHTTCEISSSIPGAVIVTAIAEGVELKEKIEIKFAATSTQFYSVKEVKKDFVREEKKTAKKSSKLIFIVAPLVIIFILAGAFFAYKYYQKVTLENYLKKGDDYFSHKKYQSALTEYENALKLNPSLFAARKACGDIYFIKKDFDKALAEYEKALELSPDDIDILKNMSDMLYRKKDFDKISGVMEHILKISPDDKDTMTKLSSVYISLKEYDKFLDMEKKISKTGQVDINSLLLAGDFYISSKNYDKGEEAFNLILAEKKNNLKALRGLSQCYEGKSDYKKLVDNNLIILKSSSSDMDTQVSTGKAYYNLKDYESASEYFTKVLRRKPDKSVREEISPMAFESLIKMGEEKLKKNDYKEGEKYFSSAEKIFPDRKEGVEGLVKSYSGQIEAYMKDKNYTKAEELCQKILDKFSTGEFADKANGYLAKIDEARPKEQPVYNPPPGNPPPKNPPPDIMDGGGTGNPDIM